MIIIKINGGLGNQMFQYAYAKAMEQKGYDVKIDITAFERYKLHGGYQLDKFNIDLEIVDKHKLVDLSILGFVSQIRNRLKIKNKNCLVEESLLFDKNFLLPTDKKYIEGYFQSEKYFLGIKDLLQKQFSLNNNQLNSYTQEIKNQIKNSENSCSLHIRRGDYLNNKNLSVHGTCDLEYYKRSIKLMNSKIKTINYFIFSDDIEWCKDNLKMENTLFIENKNSLPHEDIYLMTLCQNNIIANSSFSWWGAWLNQNDDKIVIAPKRWFADDELYKQSGDIVCDKWIKI